MGNRRMLSRPVEAVNRRGLAAILSWALLMICARADRRFRASANDRGAVCGLLLSEGGGRRIGKRLGLQAHLFPLFKIVLKTEFALDFVKGEEQELADEGEVGGVAGRDAVLGDGLEEFAEHEVDVCGGHQSAGKRSGELGAEPVGFDNLALSAGVENAERRVIVLAEHATGAVVSKRELTERGFVGGDAGTRLL